MSRYPHHDAVVAWAKQEERMHVAEQPPGSNTGVRIRYYQDHTWLKGTTRWPWCVAFCQTAWADGGKTALPWLTAGAHDLGDRARKAGWAVHIGDLIPGDLLDWGIGSGHASIFLGYDAKTKLVRSIDGNVSDQVAYRERTVSLVRTAIHVPENPVIVAEVPKPKPPTFEVVTSASGHSKVVYVSGEKAISRKLGQLLNRYGGVTIRRRR